MFLNVKNMIFLSTLMMGTFIAISSSSWFVCWLGLEINLMSLIPLLINKLVFTSTETAIKYFLVQALASMFIMLSGVLFNKHNLFNPLFLNNEILAISLSIKAGMAPFHFWFPQMIEMSDWFQATLVLTWQKIAPLILMKYSLSNIIFFIIIMSCVVGSLGGINQTLIKKILVFSSISHSSWMLSIVPLNEKMWWVYFSIYSIVSLSLIYPFFISKISSFNEMNFSKFSNFSKSSVFLNFFSLAGLPPFTGFLAKLMVILFLLKTNISLLVIFSLTLTSLISLYYYTQTIFVTMLLSQNNVFLKYSFNGMFEEKMLWLLLLSLLSNIFMPFLVW